MARYLELDEMDVTFVFKKHKIDGEKIAVLWGRALKESIRSDRAREFRDHVLDFFQHKGKKIWGNDFNSEATIDKFKSAAGIR